MSFQIGLTGNIGCGKSAVGAMLRQLGAEYLDADAVVHDLLAAGSPVAEEVIRHFGEAMRAPDGGVDRRKLGALVFSDRDRLAELEAIVVPGVRLEIRRRLEQSTAPVIVVDAIKLIESELYRQMHGVWVVTCDPNIQRQRLIEQRGLTPLEVESRINVQPPQEQKVQHATVIIDNSGTLEETRRQVEEAWRRTVTGTITS